MKELNAQQTQLLIDYLNKRINRNREAAEKYRSCNSQLVLVVNGQEAEADCALAYLMGLLHSEQEGN